MAIHIQKKTVFGTKFWMRPLNVLNTVFTCPYSQKLSLPYSYKGESSNGASLVLAHTG